MKKPVKVKFIISSIYFEERVRRALDAHKLRLMKVGGYAYMSRSKVVNTILTEFFGLEPIPRRKNLMVTVADKKKLSNVYGRAK